MKKTLRVLLCAGVAATALAATAPPAAAGPCWKVVWTEHQILDGPPGPDVWVMVPTVILTNC